MSARVMIRLGEPPAAIISFERELLIVTSVMRRTCSKNIDASAKIGGSRKFLENGVLFILRPDGKTYNAQGAQVK